jgi:sugar O-acyltransferase (sialic acid O-acetyltransferase NeuD family)
MRVVIVGAGGHARSVIEALRSRACGLEIVACTDPNRDLVGQLVDGVPVVGDDEHLPQLLAEGVTGACLGVGGVGDNGPRARVFGRLRELGFELPQVVHATAIVAASARLGAGTQVLAGAIVGAAATVGEDVIVNSAAVVEHDCRIADHAHLATASALGGGTIVGEGAHVGIGACVLQGISIGERALIGAGAVVIRPVGADMLAVGCPASARPRKL